MFRNSRKWRKSKPEKKGKVRPFSFILPLGKLWVAGKREKNPQLLLAPIKKFKFSLLQWSPKLQWHRSRGALRLAGCPWRPLSVQETQQGKTQDQRRRPLLHHFRFHAYISKYDNHTMQTCWFLAIFWEDTHFVAFIARVHWTIHCSLFT